MRKGGRLFILLGVALALVAALLAIVAFSGVLGQPEEEGNAPAKANVVVAARDIPANTVLSEDDIQVTQVDASGVAPGSATSPAQVVGMAVSGNLVKGQQILAANLVAPGLTFDLAEGRRAIALPVDRINALGGMIRPDDRIDIIYSVRINLSRVVPSEPLEVRDTTTGYAKDDTLVLQPPPGAAEGQTYPYPGEPGSRFLVEDNAPGNPVTKVVVQNVRVLRVIAGDTTVSNGTSATGDGEASSTPTAPQGAAEKLPDADLLVLEVDPQQAEVIKFLMDNDGQYQVVLRPKDDNGAVTTTGVTYEQLVNEYGLPVPKTVRLPGGGQ
ncbi:Flp pilus assembly protein CpaB [Sphaerobacter sp.]|uniref:Flp pilus assembly protein CpaB n=1 Tax=Sphaerobacter sp. TaxID=2099654 RepID=UPI001D3B09CA|nr:Flp pilus assembly protein CpaB [Sphaerobacter sp.]MBX5445651.1 Flp pilus assembly protein CpaB [Sphaerobacter sp.]